MFDRKNVDCWSCDNLSKIVVSRYMDTDTHNIYEAKFSLDEIKDIKYKIGQWYFVEFNAMPGKEYALPENIIEDDFNISFSETSEVSQNINYANSALDNYYRVGF